MLGQGNIQDIIRKHADFVRDQVKSGHQPTEDELMAVASDLLFVESSLANLHKLQANERTAAEDGLPAGEVSSHIHAVLAEAIQEIRAVKEVLSTREKSFLDLGNCSPERSLSGVCLACLCWSLLYG